MFATMPRQTRLASCLAAVLVVAPAAQAATRTVTNCSDSDAGSLRSAIANASATGDTIVFDTAQMACSTITLTSGQISIGSQQLTIQGPVASTLTIDGFHSSRVLVDTGYNRQLTINNLTIANGTTHAAAPNSIVSGGCILTNGDLVLTASTVTGCVVRNDATSGSGAGGGIAAYRLHMQSSVVSNNAAYGYKAGGGGIFLSGLAVIQASTISGNRAQAATILGWTTGGGITSEAVYASNGAVQIVSSVINKNEADYGGGVAMIYGTNPRTVSIDHSTVSGNRSRRYAGGVFFLDNNYHALTATIVNSTISGNRSYGAIGGVYSGANLTVRNSTIAFNRADSGISYGVAQAAGLCSGRVATLQSSIIANNTVGVGSGSDMNGPTGSTMLGSENLIMATLAGTTAPPGTLTANPLLGPLADNGGPTLTRALLAGSPAIATGNNLAQLVYDQRGPGFPRSFAGRTDIGAFQTNDGIFYDGFD